MAGVTNSKMVAESCKAGIIGSLGAATLSPEDIKKQVQEVRDQTEASKNLLNVNLFVLEHYDTADYSNRVNWLENYYSKYGLDFPQVQKFAPNFQDQFNAILELAPPIASFTFGILSKEQVDKLHSNGVRYVIGTATSTPEAIAWEKAGADAICAQGYEAGGHRGQFPDSKNSSDVGLFALVPEIKAHVSIPVIAAGGISDIRGVKAAQILGADAVQMGTVFLTSDEATMPPAYREVMTNGNQLAHNTTLTNAFSGRYARGVRNKFIDTHSKLSDDQIPNYPVLNALTQPLRKHDPNDPDNLSLWSGQGLYLARKTGRGSVKDIVSRLQEAYNN